jgi:hypothetical protein
MSMLLVIGALATALTILFAWAFRNLPGERWQILATVPLKREPDGDWRCVNLTYYGVFNALAVASAVAVAIFLPGTVGLPTKPLVACIVASLAVVLPASKIVNRMVEGHWHGFTVGGGCFVGMTAGPWLIRGVSRLTMSPEDAAAAVPYVLGAMAVAYALGEGIGRLACISFGCCYGRPIAESPSWMRTLFGRWGVVFEGQLKKAAYAHGYEGQRLLPVQAMTAVVSSLAGLAGIALYLSGRPLAALVLAIVTTQAWRFVSEFLRADWRGRGRISAYQWMALAGAVYTILLATWWPNFAGAKPDVMRGLALLATPGAILLIEAVAVVVFFRMGLSTVTSARAALVLEDKVLREYKGGARKGESLAPGKPFDREKDKGFVHAATRNRDGLLFIRRANGATAAGPALNGSRSSGATGSGG